MAESLVGKIVSNAGKQWNRNTVADGTWLNTNTIQKFNENDKVGITAGASTPKDSIDEIVNYLKENYNGKEV